MTLPTALVRIREALDWDAADGDPVAIGWATVELDRAALELGGELGVEPDTFVATAGSVALGAHCRVAPGVLPGGLSLVILEPSTEGRLAATLARLGEGPAVIWALADGAGDVADVAAATNAAAATDAAATSARAAHPGPFGPERLLPGSVFGPHRFLIRTAPSTIGG